MADLSELRFFQAVEHDCGYLPERRASNIFVDPTLELDASVYSFLSNYGFRRSGNHVYRPHCNGCQACVPYRVAVSDFTPSRSQKRCIKRNRDLKVCKVTRIDKEEYYLLYAKYISLRHQDGDMYPPTREQYENFLTTEWGLTHFLAMRDENNALVSVAVCDQLSNGLSAMYSFFDPELSLRGLGVFNILYQIEWARELDLRYLYLGYWIKDCRKMAYKMQYHPYQLFENGQWRSYP